MGEQTPHPLGGDNSQTPHLLGGDIVATLNEIMYYGTFPEGSVYGQAILEAADEIERLRVEVRSQALELLVAHSEALDLYNLTTPTDKEAT